MPRAPTAVVEFVQCGYGVMESENVPDNKRTERTILRAQRCATVGQMKIAPTPPTDTMSRMTSQKMKS